MKKILHLFPILMSLYGEYGNVAILKRELENMGEEVTVTESESADVNFSDFDFVYVGSGTEDNLMEAAARLADAKESILASMQTGTFYLATGNAMALFGKTLARGNRQVAGVEAFPFTTQMRDEKRYLGDVLSTDSNLSAARALGFVNTACVYTGIQKPLLVLEMGSKLGNDKQSAADGILEENFIGTQLVGPFLVKNPHFLKLVAEKLTGKKMVLSPKTNQFKAYESALRQLLGRLQK